MFFFFVVDAWKVLKHKPYDHKVDVFSFGVLQGELLTGKVICHFFGSDNECRWKKYNSLQKITLLYLQKIDGCTDFISVILFSDWNASSCMSTLLHYKQQLVWFRWYSSIKCFDIANKILLIFVYPNKIFCFDH